MLLKICFSVGSVSVVGKDARFRVRSRSELSVIIDHFNKYPLQSTKALNFRYFCEILNLINNKDHTNIQGFLKLASLINILYFIYFFFLIYFIKSKKGDQKRNTKLYCTYAHTSCSLP